MRYDNKQHIDRLWSLEYFINSELKSMQDNFEAKSNTRRALVTHLTDTQLQWQQIHQLKSPPKK